MSFNNYRLYLPFHLVNERLCGVDEDNSVFHVFYFALVYHSVTPSLSTFCINGDLYGRFSHWEWVSIVELMTTSLSSSIL